MTDTGHKSGIQGHHSAGWQYRTDTVTLTDDVIRHCPLGTTPARQDITLYICTFPHLQLFKHETLANTIPNTNTIHVIASFYIKQSWRGETFTPCCQYRLYHSSYIQWKTFVLGFNYG